MIINFPPRDETLKFFSALKSEKYPNGIDDEGIAVWLQEYLLYRVNGSSHVNAQERVFAEIDTVRGSKPNKIDISECAGLSPLDMIKCVYSKVNPPHTAEGAFEVTKRVAWLARGLGAGLLQKNSGENVVEWHGLRFSASRIVMRDGHLYKLLSDVPGGNIPSFQDEGIDPSLILLRIEALDPDS